MLLSNTQYTRFWIGNDYQNAVDNGMDVWCQRVPVLQAPNDILKRESQCFTNSKSYLNKLLSRKDQTLSDKRNISFNRELCIVIITTSPFDQHQARNDLDNFNTTLSSLLYSYQIYLKKHGHTINMNDHIVIFEYSTKNKNTYKKYYVNKYRIHHGIGIDQESRMKLMH